MSSLPIAGLAATPVPPTAELGAVPVLDQRALLDLTNNTTLGITYVYDAASRRTSMVDATGTTTYAYDIANRLTSVTAPTNGTVSYGYNAAGERTSLTYPSTNQVAYTYTNRGQLDTVTDWLSGVTDYDYDAAGRLTDISYPNGVTGTLAYDDAARLTDITYANGLTTLEDISYTLNAVGIRTSMTDLSGTTDWTYDDLYRLTDVEYPNSDEISYVYDDVGNRTSLTINGVTTTNTFDNADRMTASGSDSYSYNANGNLTSKTVSSVTTTYTYDALNRMTGISGPTTASYDYDGDNRRVSKTVNSVTTNYTWDRMGLGVVIDDGEEYVWGLGLIGQITGSSVETYAHQDGLGSIRVLTDDTGASVGTQEYDAFGATRAQSGTQLSFTYTGEQVDVESGLVYLRARYLDPTQGRFQTKDPYAGTLVEPQSLLRFAYVRNRPTTLVDPSGLTDYEGSLGVGSGGGVGGGGYPIKPQPPAVPPVEGPMYGPPIPDIPRYSPPGYTGPFEPPAYPGTNPSSPPSPGWYWKGPPGSTPEQGPGAWVNPNQPTESLSPNLNHEPPIGPHWDWNVPFHRGSYRLYPNGCIEAR